MELLTKMKNYFFKKNETENTEEKTEEDIKINDFSENYRFLINECEYLNKGNKEKILKEFYDDELTFIDHLEDTFDYILRCTQSEARYFIFKLPTNGHLLLFKYMTKEIFHKMTHDTLLDLFRRLNVVVHIISIRYGRIYFFAKFCNVEFYGDASINILCCNQASNAQAFHWMTVEKSQFIFNEKNNNDVSPYVSNGIRYLIRK